MRTHIITIMDLYESVESAITCANTCALHGITAQLFPATTPDDDAHEIIETILGRKISTNILQMEPRPERVLSCLASQMRLWNSCVEVDEDFLILEHDARMITPLPDIEVDGVISLGKPSWNKELADSLEWEDGLNVMTNWNRPFLGNHAIMMSPTGAKQILDRMRNPEFRWLHPADMMMTPAMMGEGLLKEYYPFPFDVQETFTTVQSGKSIDVKNYVPVDYKVL